MNDNLLQPAGAERFDVRAFARTAQGSLRAEIDTSSYAEAPLSGEIVRMLRYLRDLEAATMQHLRNVLVTATHKDARVTAFLVSWAFEKFWIADALDLLVEANGAESAVESAEGVGKRRHDHAEAPDRHGPVRRAIAAIRLGTPIIAVHVASGLIDEWITRAAYEAVVVSADDASLTATISRLLEIKARHSLFFGEDARRRLAESPRAARLANRTLNRMAWPLGSITRSADDRAFFEAFAFGSEQGRARAAELETAIAALPGIQKHVAAEIRERLVP